MGFSMLFIFAVLQISLLYAGVNSSSSISTEDLSNIHSTNSSNHHHRHARGAPSSASAVKNEDQDMLDVNLNMELVESHSPPEDAVLVTHKNEDHYILLSGKCNKVQLELQKRSDASSRGANKVRRFLVNKDNFELLEWKTWEDIHKDQIPVYLLIICKNHYIARVDGTPTLIKINLKKTKNSQTEFLTLNYDIKWQHLQIDSYEIKDAKRSETLEVLKQFTAHNRNCAPAKHVVKLDQGSDRSRSFIKGRTHTVGGAIEGSVSGKLPCLVKLGGKLTVKYDYSNLASETTSKLDKVLHSLSMDIEVPPNHSCTIEISSKTFMGRVPYTGQLIRKYRNNEERRTSITGNLDHQEVAELLTSVNPCTPLEDKAKC